MNIYKINKINQFIENETVEIYGEEIFLNIIKRVVFNNREMNFIDGVEVFESKEFVFNISKIDLTKLKLWEIESKYLEILDNEQAFELLKTIYPNVLDIVSDSQYFFHFQSAKDLATSIFRDLVRQNFSSKAN